jgi:hypothetical protein
MKMLIGCVTRSVHWTCLHASGINIEGEIAVSDLERRGFIVDEISPNNVEL